MEHLWDKVAAEFGVTPQEVRCEIQNAIAIAMLTGSAEVQEHWGKLCEEGMNPTPEEVVRYISMLVTEQVQ